MKTDAIISDCGRYRYTLSRVWDPSCYPLVFCMLNPSTADAEENDPTIRRCIGFARNNGYGGIVVVNLFAYRATNPTDIPATDNDAIGAVNPWHIIRVVKGLDVVVAWGANARATPLVTRGALAVIREHAREVLCLGVTKSGAPRHPLYVASSQPLIPYEVANG